MHNRVDATTLNTRLPSLIEELRSSHQTLGRAKHDASHLMTYLPDVDSSLHPAHQTAFSFILDFIESPPNPPKFHQLQEPLAFLLTRFCQNRNIPTSEAEMLVEESRLLIRAITRSSGPPTRISRPQYPLYYFLLASRKNEAFQYFGLMCHDRILAAPTEDVTIKRSRKYDLSLHLERFLTFVPIPPTPAHDFVSDQRTDYLDAALYIFQSWGRGKGGRPLSHDTVDHLARTLRLALENQPRPPVDSRLSTRIANDEVMYGDLPGPSEKTLNDDDEESPDGTKTFHHSYESTRTSALQEGESPEEHSRLSPTAPEADLPVTNLLTWIRHRALARDARIHSSMAYWWERRCPPLSIDVQLWLLAQSGRPEAAVAWLVKHTGLNADTAVTIKLLRSNEVPSEGVFLDAIDANHMALRYVRPREWCGFNSDNLLICLDGCENTTSDITIPLPPLVCKGLEPYLHRRLSSDRGLAGTESADIFFLCLKEAPAIVSVPDVNRFLRHELTTSDSLTLPSLARAFKLMYEGRYGLNEVLSCYISGRVPCFLRAPLFYTRVRLADLTQHYWDASGQYAHALLEELTAGHQPSDDATTVLRTLVKRAPQPPDEIVSSSAAFGSKAVPRVDTVTSFFQGYRDCLDDLAAKISLDDRRRHFNHFMIYSFLAFGFASAIRPVSDANLRDHHVRHDSEDPDLVLVADKANQRYDDSRFIPLTRTGKALVSRALQARALFTAYLGHRRKPRYDHLAQKDWPIFFLLDSELRILLLTPKLIRQHLEDIGLGNRYRVPLNGNRHFFRSHLWPMLPARLLHAILGHQHQGQEWMGRVSVSTLDRTGDLLTREIDSMLELLDIAPVTFTQPI